MTAGRMMKWSRGVLAFSTTFLVLQASTRGVLFFSVFFFRGHAWKMEHRYPGLALVCMLSDSIDLVISTYHCAGLIVTLSALTHARLLAKDLDLEK